MFSNDNGNVQQANCQVTVATPTPTPTPETLSVTLTPNPSSGTAPLSSTLSALVSGTAVGTINYNFWWNCAYSGTDIATASSTCGTLTAPAAGSCVETAGVGYKCNGVNTNPEPTASHIYNASSTAKVIAERGTAPSAQSQAAVTITNSAPVTSNVTVTEPDYCVSGPSAFVSWTYSDPDGSTQSAYQVQVDDTGSAWNGPVIDSGKVLSSGTSYFLSSLLFNVTYKARARTWDAQDLVSTWTEESICNGPGCLGGGGSWKTPQHPYPLVNFTWSPLLDLSANQPIQFTDQAAFSDGSGLGQRGWNWLFGDGGSAATQNPSHTYASSSTFNVTETVTDKSGYACALAKPIGIERPIPVWREVSPR